MELYTLHRYLKADGSFDYDKYREIQAAGNRKKLHNVWVREEHIEYVSGYLREHLPLIGGSACAMAPDGGWSSSIS